MEDDVGLTDQRRERSWVADVPKLQPVPGIEIRRSLTAVTVHLGLDLFAEAGTPVHAPIEGVVELVANNTARGDYAPAPQCAGQGR